MVKFMGMISSIILVALALLMGGQSAWAAANNQNNSTPPELFIDQIFATDPTGAGGCGNVYPTLTIEGVMFDNVDFPSVTFGDHTDTLGLTVCSATATTIVVELPDTLANLTGNHRIEIYTGTSVQRYDAYDLTIGSVGPQGPAGNNGATGATGPAGAQGAPGMSGFETIVLTNLFLSGLNPPPNVLTCPAGKTAISGGVDLTNAISGLGHVVRASYPSASNQWTVAASAPDGAGSSQTLATAYVQCAFVQ